MAEDKRKIIVAFDLYGTLLSTESIAKVLATHFGEETAQSIAALWRRYQLEYTWRLNSMGVYQEFSEVTRQSLQHALADSAVSLSQENIETLMGAYDSLSAFPDVAPALEALADQPHVVPVIFSNGTSSMVTNSVNRSPDLSPFSKIFRQIVVVEGVKRFKPAPEVYIHLNRVVGKSKHQIGDVWLVSGNPFDVVGARRAGMQAAWVDRAGHGWTDRLLDKENLQPTAVVNGLGEVLQAISRHA